MHRYVLPLILLAIGRYAFADAPPAKPDAPPKPAPPEQVASAELEGAIRRGVNFLVTSQNEDGSWGSPERTKGLNIMASPPGSLQAFQTGTTALAIAALSEVGQDTPEAKRALERGETWLMESLPKLRRANPTELYNVWGHGYGV